MVGWLNRYKVTKQEIAVVDIEIVNAELEYYRWRDGDLSNGYPYAVSLAKQRELLKYMEDKREAKNRLIKQQTYIENVVDQFDGILNLIAKEKYINGKTIAVIAEENNYTTQYLYNKHAEIKRILKHAEVKST